MASRQNKKSSKYPKPSILVSACLAGINCTYKGGNKTHRAVKRLVDQGLAIPVCPEVMGGLTTPRENSEIVCGEGATVVAGKSSVVSASGKDLSRQYLAGSSTILDVAARYNIRKAILKSKSPACGHGHIYDGTFRKVLKRGDGILAAILLKHGLAILTEKEL